MIEAKIKFLSSVPPRKFISDNDTALNHSMAQFPSAKVATGAYTIKQPKVAYRSRRVIDSKDEQTMMRITIDSEHVASLRHLILLSCGDMVSYLRVEPLNQSKKINVWLSVRREMVEIVIHAVTATLPGAEFGKITSLSHNDKH